MGQSTRVELHLRKKGPFAIIEMDLNQTAAI